jgi:mannose-6-phosphate isomerase-like protein (cupin superfamily)
VQRLDDRGVSRQQRWSRRRRPAQGRHHAGERDDLPHHRVLAGPARNHRTDSIDYIVVLSGEIEMELDDTVVQLKAGDVMVQRGTIHNWVNRGTQPCVLAVILIAAKPVEAGGKVLNAVG